MFLKENLGLGTGGGNVPLCDLNKNVGKENKVISLSKVNYIEAFQLKRAA